MKIFIKKIVFTHFKLLWCMIFLGIALVSCKTVDYKTNSNISIIPEPQSLQKHVGCFSLNATTKIYLQVGNKSDMLAAKLLVGQIKKSTNEELKIKEISSIGRAPKRNCIVMCIDPRVKTGEESYSLEVTKNRVTIVAPKAAGLYYGVQTLLQLLPAEVFSINKAKCDWQVPCVTIKDSPRFSWRGMMLDSSRHFQSVQTVKRYLDLMAMHKLNVFHWHLVDGHGWRIEIKKYPKLTSVGAWRKQPGYKENGGIYGGFYTQKQIRDIVKYAAERFITIVPEIEMPGHSQEVMAAYPNLACKDEEQEVAYFFTYPCKRQAFPHLKGSNVFCAGNDETFEFLENVLLEVFELFPSHYIHVGGDECNKKYWRTCPKCHKRIKDEHLKNLHGLQSYFMKRIEKFINKHGRRMIGWNEILEGGLAPNATVMSWQGEKPGIKAAKMGHDIVMSPNHTLYFDHAQSRSPNHPPSWPGISTLEKVYNYNPIPKVFSKEDEKHLIGVQANVWTCFINTQDLLDLMTYPRACALSELSWSLDSVKNYADFTKRMNTHLQRLDYLNVKYYVETSVQVGSWNKEQITTQKSTITANITAAIKKAGTFSIAFRYKSGKHALNIFEVALLKNGKEICKDIHQGLSGFALKKHIYKLKIDKYSPKDKYTIRATVSGSGGGDSNGYIYWMK